MVNKKLRVAGFSSKYAADKARTKRLKLIEYTKELMMLRDEQLIVTLGPA